MKGIWIIQNQFRETQHQKNAIIDKNKWYALKKNIKNINAV